MATVEIGADAIGNGTGTGRDFNARKWLDSLDADETVFFRHMAASVQTEICLLIEKAVRGGA